MRKIILSIFVVLVLGSLNFVAAQSAKRLYFKRGATSVIAAGSLRNYRSSQTFVMRVRAGQTINTEQLKSNNSLRYVSVFITDPNGEEVGGDYAADCHNRREVPSTIAGDYKFKIVECRKADPWRGNFRVKITVK